MKVYKELLFNLSTFRLPTGTTEVYEAETPQDLEQLYNEKFFENSWILLGGGSNTVFQSVPQRVLKINFNTLTVKEFNKEYVLVCVGAGYNWHQLVTLTVEKGWWGLENLALIPGTTGAAPVQNIGAYGQEVRNTIDSVVYFSIETGELITLTSEQCQFEYRDSIFKHALKNKAIIVEVIFRLSLQPTPILTYPALQEKLSILHQVTQKDIFDTVVAIRSQKLADPAVQPNCGSFFKNPIINKKTALQLKEAYPDIPLHMHGDHFKTSAAWLIDNAGLKGIERNGIRIHDKQPLVLINTGSATPEALESMVQLIQETVEKRFQIQLEREVNIV